MSHHCMIAVSLNDQYRTIYCHFLAEPSEKSAGPILRHHYASFDDAMSLIELGDINDIDEKNIDAFYRDWGHPWEEVRPTDFSSLDTLTDYACSIGCQYVYVFQLGFWQTLILAPHGDVDCRLKKTA